MTLGVNAKAKALQASGRDLIVMGVGEPDFDTPDHIKEACIEALRAGVTKYTDAQGTKELRQAISDKLKRDNNLSYKPDEIIVGMGGKHVLFELFQALLDPGDEVLIPAPYWTSYPDMVAINDGVPVILPTTFDSGFRITPDQVEEAITPRTRAIIINSPSNPTGMVYSRPDLIAIVRVATEAGVLVISDELYEKLTYDGLPHHTVAALDPGTRDLVVTVNGLSKAFSMTGWRLGYAAGPKPLIDAMTKVQSHSTSNPVSFAQAGALVALRHGYDFLPPFLAAYDERRRILVDAMRAIPGVRCHMPQGAFYVFPDLSELLGKKAKNGQVLATSLDVSDYLLEQGGVAVVPGEAFGAPACLRLSYATDTDAVREAGRRIANVLTSLH